MQGFDNRIDANKGLKQAIRRSLGILSTASTIDTQTPCAVDLGFRVRIQRTMIAPMGAALEERALLFPAVTIESKGEILGVLPESEIKPGNTQIQSSEVFIPFENISGRALNLTFQTGLDPMKLPFRFKMGQFRAFGSWDGAEWNLFSRPDGTPFGVTQQILNYSGIKTNTKRE